MNLLIHEYSSGDILKHEFIKVYNRCTKDYKFFYINNTSVKDGDLNCLYGVFKAEKYKYIILKIISIYKYIYNVTTTTSN